MVVGGEDMERIYPKKKKLRPVSLREAAEMQEIHKEEVIVLFPTDDTCRTYERQTLEEFMEDCMLFVEE